MTYTQIKTHRGSALKSQPVKLSLKLTQVFGLKNFSTYSGKAVSLDIIQAFCLLQLPFIYFSSFPIPYKYTLLINFVYSIHHFIPPFIAESAPSRRGVIR